MDIIIDSREQKRIPIAEKYFKSQDYTVKTSELKTGDYLINNEIVFEFKTWSDFISSITDGRLWNETQRQMENYNIHFIVLHGTNRDYKTALNYSGLTSDHVTGAIA